MEAAGLGNKLISYSGVNLSLTKNIIINSGKTLSNGTKFTGITTTGTLTITGAMDVTTYTSPAGTFVKIGFINAQVSVTGVTRTQMYNVTDVTELWNRVTTTTSESEYLQYTTDKSFRLRCMYVDGPDANTEYEAFGTFSSTGFIFDIRGGEDDPVYIANNIDGFTCSEFAADDANVECDVIDTDNQTTVQRFYAWYKAELTTATGISAFWGAVNAKDVSNYIVNQSIVSLKFDNKKSDLLKIYGGTIINADGSTNLVSATTTGSIYFHSGDAPAVVVWSNPSRTLTDGTAAVVLKIKTDTGLIGAAL